MRSQQRGRRIPRAQRSDEGRGQARLVDYSLPSFLHRDSTTAWFMDERQTAALLMEASTEKTRVVTIAESAVRARGASAAATKRSLLALRSGQTSSFFDTRCFKPKETAADGQTHSGRH